MTAQAHHERPNTAGDVRVVRRWLGSRRRVPEPGLAGPSAAFTSPVDAACSFVVPDWNNELPSTSLELVLELDAGWEVEIDGQRTNTTSFAAGLVAGRVRTRSTGAMRLVQLCLDPLATPALFGLPAGELAGAVIGLEHVLGRGAAELLDRIDEADGARDDAIFGAAADRDRPATVAVAEAWVRERMREAEAESPQAVPPDVRWACALMRASGGALRTQAVADELGCSRRHLARRFDEFVGVAPSQYTRLLRFEHATGALRRDPSQPIGALAHACHYADHAHMNRDFRALAGATPSAVAARFIA